MRVAGHGKKWSNSKSDNHYQSKAPARGAFGGWWLPPGITFDVSKNTHLFARPQAFRSMIC
jgi:hypothetical protein